MISLALVEGATPEVRAVISYARSIAVVEGSIWIATQGVVGDMGVVESGRVVHVEPGGGIEEIYRADGWGPSEIAGDSDGVFWIQPHTELRPDGLFTGLMGLEAGLAVDLVNQPRAGIVLALSDDAIYWWSDGDIVATSRSQPTTTSTVISSASVEMRALRVHGDALFWIADGTVWTAPRDGGAAVALAEVIGTETAGVESLAVDATHVYWTEYDAGQVMRVPRAGGTAALFADGQDEPRGIVLDDTTAYWSNDGSGNVVALAK